MWTLTQDNSAFSFFGACNSTEYDCGSEGCSGRIFLLEGRCETSAQGTSIKFTTDKNIVQDAVFRLNVNVSNPSYLSASGGITVQSDSRLSSLILEKRSFTGLFSVVGVTVGTPTIKYLWGVASTAVESSKTKCLVGFYKGGGTYPVYNNFEMTFTVGQTPSGQPLRVVVAIPASTEFGILPGSIYTDMPQFPGKSTKVSVDTTTNQIIIDYVGPLTSEGARSYVLKGIKKNDAFYT